MADYRLATSDPNGVVIRTADNAMIPPDPGNSDWRQYQEWLKAGGIVEVHTSPLRIAMPNMLTPTTLEVDPVGPMDAVTKRYVDEQIVELERTLRRT